MNKPNKEEVVYSEQGAGLINQTKSGIKEAVASVVKKVNDGEYDFFKALIFAAKLSKLGKDLDAAIRPIASEKNKLSKSEVYTLYSADIQKKETGVSYDFTVCNDPVWVRLSNNLELAKKDLKEHEDLLKTLTKPKEMIDEDSGEFYTCKPPVRKSTDGLTVTIK